MTIDKNGGQPDALCMTDPENTRRFSGISRLYGPENLDKFYAAHVCVVGLGGVGSWVVEALARSGIGHITLIDLDNVAKSNVNRQLHAVSSNFGKPKVQAMKERIADISPMCHVTEIEDFITEDNLSEYFSSSYDFVIDAIDHVRVKAAMADYFLRHKQAFAVSGGAGGQCRPDLLKMADLSQVTHDKLLSNMRYRLRKQHGFTRDTKKKMRIPCVYSLEDVKPPQTQELCDAQPQGLSCAGYGASMLVTATFGLYLSNMALNHIATRSAL